MAQWKFIPPTVEETPAGGHILFARYKLPRGISVLRLNGVYSSYRYPSLTEINEATEYYRGGSEHIIDDTTKDALTAAGYGAYITAV
jgi:hypothetical protein